MTTPACADVAVDARVHISRALCERPVTGEKAAA
jgi:hypothetical protein